MHRNGELVHKLFTPVFLLAQTWKSDARNRL